jgi:hypothetical protein
MFLGLASHSSSAGRRSCRGDLWSAGARQGKARALGDNILGVAGEKGPQDLETLALAQQVDVLTGDLEGGGFAGRRVHGAESHLTGRVCGRHADAVQSQALKVGQTGRDGQRGRARERERGYARERERQANERANERLRRCGGWVQRRGTRTRATAMLGKGTAGTFLCAFRKMTTDEPGSRTGAGGRGAGSGEGPVGPKRGPFCSLTLILPFDLDDHHRSRLTTHCSPSHAGAPLLSGPLPAPLLLLSALCSRSARPPPRGACCSRARCHACKHAIGMALSLLSPRAERACNW